MPIFDYNCSTCGATREVLQRVTDPAPVCHGPMVKQFGTPAFTFANGKGTDGGQLMRIASKTAPHR